MRKSLNLGLAFVVIAGSAVSFAAAALTAFAATEFTGADAAKTNKQLAKQRLKAIQDILTAAGIDSDRLVDTKVEYVGDQKPNVVRSRLATASLM